MGIFEYLERLRVEREFKKAISPHAMARLEKPGTFPRPDVVETHFQFVVVHIQESAHEELPKIINRVVSTLINHRATLSGITSSLVVATMGVPFPEYDLPEMRSSLVTALLRENGKSVRIAHGQCDGLVGLLGSKGGWRYDAVVPEFSGVLKKLFETEFGTAIEIA